MNPRDRVAQRAVFPFLAALFALALSSSGASSSTATSPADIPALPPPSNGAISPQDQADTLHFVIAADREMYCREYTAHQAEGKSPQSTAVGGNSAVSWPSPSEMLRRAAESIQNKGAEFSYALRSLHPVDPRDGPQTELEQRGLAFVTSHPTQNYYGHEMLGGRRYFTAVYPDIPAADSSADVRNPGPARGHAGDLLGAIVVRVPLEF
jgi:hypothetical protein